MARWSDQSGWGQSERSVTTRFLIVALVATLFIGAAIGFLIKPSGGSTPETAKDLSSSQIVSPNIQAVTKTSHDSDGAVRAVTSFITGLPDFLLLDESASNSVIDNIVDPNADPSVKASMRSLYSTGRTQLFGSSSSQTAGTVKYLIAPASYKVDMANADNARVQVWYTAVIVDATSESAVSRWTTNDVVVTWANGWKINKFTATDGPTPRIFSDSGQPSSYSEIVNRFNGFFGFRPAVVPTKADQAPAQG